LNPRRRGFGSRRSTTELHPIEGVATVGMRGIEPLLLVPKTSVMPLHYTPVIGGAISGWLESRSYRPSEG
jgi:hypothetical protein